MASLSLQWLESSRQVTSLHSPDHAPTQSIVPTSLQSLKHTSMSIPPFAHRSSPSTPQAPLHVQFSIFLAIVCILLSAISFAARQ